MTTPIAPRKLSGYDLDKLRGHISDQRAVYTREDARNLLAHIAWLEAERDAALARGWDRGREAVVQMLDRKRLYWRDKADAESPSIWRAQCRETSLRYQTYVDEARALPNPHSKS